MKRFFAPTILLLSIVLMAAGVVDLNNLFDYQGLSIPTYILKDNTPPSNAISNEAATLGRVLFYDKQLSANNSISCASCHQQAFAFGDTSLASVGLNGGLTGRHAMRLVNSRFGDEERFFWDERAASLEDQSTQPIRDHIEMGFSGFQGDPDMDSLIRKISGFDYYRQMFSQAFGSPIINEARMRQALSQFMRSIQSFDSRFDTGYAQANSLTQPFPNFSPQENQGKMLFLQSTLQGGAGCQGCHRAPEFDIDPRSRNNGVIGVIGDTANVDLTNTRAPSLRDLINPDGLSNGPFMHDGSLKTLMDVVNHYDSIPFDSAINNELDMRLRGRGPGQGLSLGQSLQLTQNEKEALVAFLKTLTGSAIYTGSQWSDPFDSLGTLSFVPLISSIEAEALETAPFKAYPNPATEFVKLELPSGAFLIQLYSLNGQLVFQEEAFDGEKIGLAEINPGMYILQAKSLATQQAFTQKLMLR